MFANPAVPARNPARVSRCCTTVALGVRIAFSPRSRSGARFAYSLARSASPEMSACNVGIDGFRP